MAKDPEKVKAYSKAYYWANKERLQAEKKKWKKTLAGRASLATAASKAQMRRVRDPEKMAAYSKKWRETNPEKWKAVVKKHDLKRHFNITPEQLAELEQKHDGVCAICKGRDPSGRRLAIDHDHTTGKIRGLLCNGCNVMLGYCKDSTERLLLAVDYLVKNGASGFRGTP